MSARRLLGAVPVLVLGLATAGAHAATIADWTFETTQPTTAGSFTPEVGSGSALGHHVATSTYSSPVGNGSAHSFSSTAWAAGDYYQFQVSTTGLSGITLSWDQTSSNTGPKDFTLQYSTNGTTFTTLSSYSVLANATPNTPWSSGTSSSAYTFTQDLIADTALNNQATLYFRLVDADTVAAGGGTVGSGGTDRVDNVTVSAVPLPGALWLLGSGLLTLATQRRRRVLA